MNYLKYKINKVEEKVISEHFKIYLSHNDMDQEDWSQPEMDHHYDFFKTGWIAAMAFITEE